MALNTEIFEEIGLTKSEIKVYMALLGLGSSTTGPIVEKSGASSSKIYEILDKLIQKGLVSYIIKAGTKYYEASDPERIMDYLDEKEKKLKDQKSDVKNILPELKLKQQISKYKSDATIYKGMKGLETAFNDVLKTLKKGEATYAFVVGSLSKPMNRFFTKQYEKRAAKGIISKTIFSAPAKHILESRKHIKTFEGKIIPSEATSPSTTNIYGSKVILRIGENKNVIAIVIDNQELADSYMEQFNNLWEQDTVVTKGIDAFKVAINDLLDNLKPGEDYKVLGATFGVKGLSKTYADFFKKVHKRRFEEGINGRILFQKSAKPHINKYGSYMQYIDTSNTDYKFSPYISDSPVAVYPSDKKTIMVIQKKEPIVIEFYSEEISDAFKKYFESMWEMTKK